jgi:hypothetical protein
MTAAVAGAETGHGDEPLDACGLHAINRLRVDSEKSVVPAKINLGEKSTPSVWITTSMSLTALRIVSRSRASPDAFSRSASLIGMFAAERDNARTLWPVRSAALTVSSPMPRLAPMMRIAAITADIGPRRKLDKRVRGSCPVKSAPIKGRI